MVVRLVNYYFKRTDYRCTRYQGTEKPFNIFDLANHLGVPTLDFDTSGGTAALGSKGVGSG